MFTGKCSIIGHWFDFFAFVYLPLFSILRLPLLGAIFGSGFIASSAIAGLHITEFMASNGSTLDDQDGDSSDWIEIYNSGSDSGSALDSGDYACARGG